MGDEYCFAVCAVGCYVAVDVWEGVFWMADHFGVAWKGGQRREYAVGLESGITVGR